MVPIGQGLMPNVDDIGQEMVLFRHPQRRPQPKNYRLLVLVAFCSIRRELVLRVQNQGDVVLSDLMLREGKGRGEEPDRSLSS
jgi:hypothetical protein